MNIKDMYDFSILRELRKREGLNIKDVSERSGVSAAVISKLERNQTLAELDTIYKLARVFGMNPSDLLNLTEARSAHKAVASSHKSGDFKFQEVKYGNIRALLGRGKAGSQVSRPKVHQDDYELCWVLEGQLEFNLPHETHVLNAGDSIQFDALLEHTYKALEDCYFMILHIRKDKRF
jgi:transcriptional regulator with XRE-family HTH domain